MNRPHALSLLVAIAVLTAGCGGPDRPLSVGFKEVPSNVVLGAQSSPSPAAPPVANNASPAADVALVTLPLPPSIVALPPPPFTVPNPDQPIAPPLPQPTGPACPKADPLQAPAIEAPTAVTARPIKAQYLFRNAGSFQVSGADARTGTFPALSVRTVSGALELDNGFLFEVAETLGDITTTTVYDVVQTQPLGSPFTPGLYIVKVTSRGSDGQESVFSPTPELQLAAFPLVRGARVQARGVDATTATSMSFVSTVTGKNRVDACGEPLDSFTLDLTEGRLVSPSQDLDFTATYQIGTQYGGLVLRETVAYAGQDRGAGISRTNTSTINQVPRATAGPRP
ncbi:MAG: hypothetical protein H7323_13560 [Frankiales bacterium]|nr:hypothetical protein [Frankiales bacterium]